MQKLKELAQKCEIAAYCIFHFEKFLQTNMQTADVPGRFASTLTDSATEWLCLVLPLQSDVLDDLPLK